MQSFKIVFKYYVGKNVQVNDISFLSQKVILYYSISQYNKKIQKYLHLNSPKK